MAALCQSLLRLRDASKAALIVVHHVRKSIGREEIGSAFRGSSALHAVGDSYLLLTRPSAHLSGHRRVALPVSLRRSAGAPIAATGPAHVVLFRRRPGALQGCRRAQEGGTGARDQGSGGPRPTGSLQPTPPAGHGCRPTVPSAPRNWPSRRLAGKAPSCRPTGSIGCRFKVRATLRRVAPAQTLPRGESGPEAGDGSAAQTCSSVLPRRSLRRFRRGSCFQKQNTGISFRACPRSQNAKTPRRAFCAGAFLMDFLAGYPVLPIQEGILSRPRAMALTPPESNLRNTVENIARMPPG